MDLYLDDKKLLVISLLATILLIFGGLIHSTLIMAIADIILLIIAYLLIRW